jgi:hypothetical protein
MEYKELIAAFAAKYGIAGLKSLINQAENWRKALEGLRMAEGAREGDAPDGAAHQDMLSSGFFHV